MIDLSKTIANSNAEDRQHVVCLWWFEGNDYTKEERLLAPSEAHDLGVALIKAAADAQSQIINDLLRGECETCGNTRMVDVPLKNTDRTDRRHCPDCYEITTTVPTLSVWADTESELGR